MNAPLAASSMFLRIDAYLATEIYFASNPFSMFSGSPNAPTFDIDSDNVASYCEEPPAYNLLLQFLRMIVDLFMVTVSAGVGSIFEMTGLSTHGDLTDWLLRSADLLPTSSCTLRTK